MNTAQVDTIVEIVSQNPEFTARDVAAECQKKGFVAKLAPIRLIAFSKLKRRLEWGLPRNKEVISCLKEELCLTYESPVAIAIVLRDEEKKRLAGDSTAYEPEHSATHGPALCGLLIEHCGSLDAAISHIR